MIYDCIGNVNEQKFVTAKPVPAIWSSSELQAPFEIVQSGDLQKSNIDYNENLNYSWGVLSVKASEIDLGLLDNG